MKESFESQAEYPVRQLTSEDWEKLRDVRTRAVLDSPQAFGDTSEQTQKREEDVWKQWINGSQNYVVEDKENVVATATLRKDTDGVWIINGVWTDPAYRGRGLSKKLLEKIFVEAKQKNLQSIQLKVNSLQTIAFDLYESLGFVEVERNSEQLMGDGQLHEQIVMEKQMSK